MIDTSKVRDFRRLRFESIGDVRRELDVLVSAHRAGTLRRSGNWTPGQVFSHLAAFIGYGFDGYPAELGSPSWLIVFILKRMKNRYLYKQLPRGVKIPRVQGGTVGAEDVSFEEGIARLREGLERVERSAPSQPNKIFGPLTHDEWKALHLRHCELHLGYLHPR